MQNNLNDFNTKYRLSEELISKLKFSDASQFKQNAQITGKPKKLGVEILKRFFSNPVVVISLLIFIIVVLMSILIPIFSEKNGIYPAQRVTNLDFTNSLPTRFNPIVSKVVDENDRYLRTYVFLRSSDFIEYLNPRGLQEITVTPRNGLFIITYNGYNFYRLNALNSDLLALRNAGETINETVVNNLWNSYDINIFFGTTNQGFDVWTRTWYATSKALKIAFIVAIIQAFIGISIGAYLGFNAGKLVDTIVMRIIGIFNSAPTLVWLLIFVTILGANEWTLVIALSIVGWPGFVGTSRTYIITVKNEEYINAAKAIGAKTHRQVFVHALPAVIGKLAYSFVRTIPGIILWIATLAFLGFFKEQNDTNLGQMLIDATAEINENIWILILPTLILLSISLTLAFVALGLHDALDPRVMSKRKSK
ncbi:ABC transporter permease [Mycoplasma sp. 1018B]|uniref:ABC transporter permease n=1 Tax=Mycoplasma sp. 1018B TaxID=2967302 RepID=UPI00211B9A2D|nr:ABC transporter permease [Mycoplasma sp. 1018B]UUM19401.1 ABC transporter permease [Mycoplasma sp. 1018B]